MDDDDDDGWMMDDDDDRLQSGHSQVTVRSQSGLSQVYSQVYSQVWIYH